MSETKELKPCPFCGKPASRWYDTGGDFDVPVCGCIYHANAYGKDMEIEWNTRPIEDSLLARVAELEELNARMKKQLDDWAPLMKIHGFI